MNVMEIHLTQHDFDRLTESSTRWAGIDWAAQDGRFEVSSPTMTEPINWKAKMVYWVGNNPAAMILAREYVKAQGFDVQVLWDMAQHPNDDFFGYALLTDYVSDNWIEHDDGIVIRSDAGHDSEWFPPEEES